MNWGQFKSQVLARLHDNSLGDMVYQWFNEVQSDLASLANWRHLEKAWWLKTVAPFSSGTVAVTNGSATVTLSGSTWPSDVVGQLWQRTSDAAYYRILTRNSDTVVTLESVYVGTNGSGAGHRVVYYAITLPTDLQRYLIDAVVLQTATSDHPLVPYVGTSELYEAYPNEIQETGTPNVYRISESKMKLWPAPNRVMQVRVDGVRKPTEMASDTSDSQTFDWDEDQVQAIYQGVLVLGYEHIDDNLRDTAERRFKEKLAACISRNNGRPSSAIRIRRWDECDGRRVRGARLPEVIG